MRRLGALGTCLVLAFAPSADGDDFVAVGPNWTGEKTGSTRSDEYQYDDGTTEGVIGLTAGGDLAWLHMFDPIAGLQTLTHVNTAFGTPLYPSSPPAGTPVDLYVWDDANNDGDPSDGVLIGQGSGVIQNPDTDILTHYALDSPVTVTSRFFIGCVVSQVAGEFPAPMDENQTSMGRAWVVGNSVMGGFDPNNLLNNDVGPYEMDSLGFPCVWLLRADAIPEPGTLSLLALSGLGPLLRRR